MRVLFVSANREEINMPTYPLGLACVAEATQQAGHDVELVDLMGVNDPSSLLEDATHRMHPEVIGISARNIDDQDSESPRFLLGQVREVVAECRRLSDAPVIVGGAGYSIFPESALDYLGADMGIQGEGEVSFPAAIQRIQRGTDLSGIPGLRLPGLGLQGERELTKNLEVLPLPDTRLSSWIDLEDPEFWLPVQTRRGCPMDCSYCSTPTIEGTIIRKRCARTVVDWLTRWVGTGCRRFYFVDNTFNLPPSYAREFCSEIAEADLDIIWRAIIYPKAMDQALVKAMAKAGCRDVSVGFESGCERILRGMNKRFTPEDVRLTCHMLADNGIRRMGFLLLGGPGETKKSVEESLRFVDSLNLEAAKVTVGIRIYSNTSLANRAIAEGLIPPNDDLLFPRFYVVRELREWLLETVGAWLAERPNWRT